LRVLVVGGSGYVASITLPYLKEHHHLRVFDLRRPADDSLEYVEGSVTDPAALARASEGIDALRYMAMGRERIAAPDFVADAYDVNVKGVALALRAAHDAGAGHAVYTSSLSVYHGRLDQRGFTDEDIPPDARETYGFTKRLGEEVCRNAWQRWGMSVNALRLCYPQPPGKWEDSTRSGRFPLATRADDVARALLAALDYRGGLQAFFISGDHAERYMRLRKAKQILGWEPLARVPEGGGVSDAVAE
jgi:nucleoside-diphosphate-sugar epimerase